jgi:ABC-type antimicrobial peptide transport system permease subunit
MTVTSTLNMYFQSFGAVSIVKVNAPWFHVRERGLLGGVFGLVIGVVAAVLVTTLLLNGSGYVQSFPVGTLVILLFVAALAGVLAAQLPARRAARMDVLAAITSE